MKNVVIIGSTGSVGTQAVDVLVNHKDLFNVVALIADNNRSLLEEQMKKTGARIGGLFSSYSEGFLHGQDCYKVCSIKEVDLVLIASTGLSALPYFTESLKAGKTVCASNKESIVAVGELLKDLAKEHGGRILPVDSEHSAIWQSLGDNSKYLKRIILTASGGPFFGKSSEQLKDVSVEQALNHPTWKMGKKITIDSATLANKGLEVIEACRLFDVSEDMVEVIVHRESVIHSMVELKDGAVISQSSYPTMEIPIQLSLTYPDRVSTKVSPIDFAKIGKLTFYPLDNDAFPFVNLARKVERLGGFYPLCYAAADEIAVQAFLEGKIKFTDIYKVVESTVENIKDFPKFLIENVQIADTMAKKLASSIIAEKKY